MINPAIILIRHPVLYTIIFLIINPISYGIIGFYESEINRLVNPIEDTDFTQDWILTPIFSFSSGIMMVYFIIFEYCFVKKIIANSVFYENALIARKIFVNVIYIVFPLFVIVNVIEFVIYGSIFLVHDIPENPLLEFHSFANNTFMYASILVFLPLVIHTLTKKFKFNLARAYFYSINFSFMTNTEKMNKLIQGIEQYNKYLQERMGRHLNNLETVYQKIVHDSDKIDKTISDLIKTFEQNDDLATAKYLMTFTGVSETKSVLSRKDKLQNFYRHFQIIGLAILIIIGAVNLLLQYVF